MNVSVIIPVYNAERFVEEAVRSALEQPETGEVLLIEDGSPDGALAVCQRLAAEHEKVRLLRHPNGENRGAGESRNLGLREARCELIAFLDADDFMLPGRFRHIVPMLDADPTLDGVYDAVGTHFENDEMEAWWRAHSKSMLTTMSRRVPPEELFEALVRGRWGSFQTDGIVVRRELIERSGLFPAHLRMCQDSALWVKMAAVGRLAPGKLDEAVAMRRLHGENRIVKHADVHKRYKRMMSWYLLRWAERQGLPLERRDLLLQGLLGRSGGGWPATWSRARRRLTIAIHIAGWWLRSPTARASGRMGSAFRGALLGPLMKRGDEQKSGRLRRPLARRET